MSIVIYFTSDNIFSQAFFQIIYLNVHLHFFKKKICLNLLHFLLGHINN